MEEKILELDILIGAGFTGQGLLRLFKIITRKRYIGRAQIIVRIKT